MSASTAGETSLPRWSTPAQAGAQRDDSSDSHSEPPTVAKLSTLRLTLAGLEAENDALRADLDSALADLDRGKAAADRLEAAQDLLRQERDAIAAHRDAVVADRELVREDLRREIEVQRATTIDQQDKIVALTAELNRVAGLATAHRQARAQAGINEYKRELQDRQRDDHEAVLRAQVQTYYDRSVAATAARRAEARRADRASAMLEATLKRVSWRVTRPLRAIRHYQLKLATRLRGTKTVTAATPRTASSPKARRGSGTRKAAPRLAGKPSGELLLDLDFYRSRYPDLAHLSVAKLGAHYASYGRREGRMAMSWLRSSPVHLPTALDHREKILVLLPDAAPTEGARLALSLIRGLSERYHVVTVLQTGGELATEIADTSGTTVMLNDSRALVGQEARVLADELRDTFRPAFAVVNSLACHESAIALEQADVPVVALVNEVSLPVAQHRSILQFFASVSDLVYPAEIVATSMAESFATALGRGHTIAVPGRVTHSPETVRSTTPRPPRTDSDGVLLDLPEVALKQFLDSVDPVEVVVIGIGSVIDRKGVDLFLDAAAQTSPALDGSPIRFVWVDEGLEDDADYRAELLHQLRRLPAGVSVTFAAPSMDLEPLYQRADLMFLSSRLDPFPSTAVDAASHGIPVVCFDRATGFVDWLRALPDGSASACVVPHLDSALAAQALIALMTDEARLPVRETLLKAAAADFQMNHYVEAIAKLGRRARLVRDSQHKSLQTILVPGRFDVVHYTGGQAADRAELHARGYLRRVQAAAPLSHPRRGLLIQRPRPGFHPLAYAESAPAFPDDGSDPFAHFLHAGSPPGRWTKRIITPKTGGNPGHAPIADRPSVLMHGHFHYPEMLTAFLELLATNQTPRKLVLTTTTNEAATQLRAICRDHPAGTDADVLLVPNRGRNLSALFSGPVAELMLDFDLVLHVHSKRSPHLAPEGGDRWRDYLWGHLLGDADGFGDHIVDEFARSPRLGLVAPEDRRLNDWDLNAHHAEDLVNRLGRTMPLPTHFDFPLGAMFWARTSALRPFLDAGLGISDYPAEPLPVDGSPLHALERLIPLVIEHDGYEFAKTYLHNLQR